MVNSIKFTIHNQQPFSQKMQNFSANAPNGGRSAEVAIF